MLAPPLLHVFYLLFDWKLLAFAWGRSWFPVLGASWHKILLFNRHGTFCSRFWNILNMSQHLPFTLCIVDLFLEVWWTLPPMLEFVFDNPIVEFALWLQTGGSAFLACASSTVHDWGTDARDHYTFLEETVNFIDFKVRILLVPEHLATDFFLEFFVV